MCPKGLMTLGKDVREVGSNGCKLKEGLAAAMLPGFWTPSGCCHT